MSNLILFLITSFGLTEIVINSDMGEIIRKWLKPIPLVGRAADKRCYLCLGFHAGWFLSPILWPICESWWYAPFLSFLGSLAASAACPIIGTLKSWIEFEYQVSQLRK